METSINNLKCLWMNNLGSRMKYRLKEGNKVTLNVSLDDKFFKVLYQSHSRTLTRHTLRIFAKRYIRKAVFFMQFIFKEVIETYCA